MRNNFQTLSKRKVIDTEELRFRYVLTLECGHTVTRKKKKSGPPKKTECEQCEILMDKLRSVRSESDGGWKSSRDLKIAREILRFLEKEGLVESSVVPRGSAIYWRLKQDNPVWT